MKNCKITLDQIDELMLKLNEYKNKVNILPRSLTSELISIAKTEIDSNIQGITAFDGNYLAKAGSNVFGDMGVAYIEGEQAKYLEYGTGAQGQSSPHPQAKGVGYNYLSGATVKVSNGGKSYWKYFDKIKQKFVITTGLPAQMPVLKASYRVRSRLKQIAKDKLR